TARRTVESRSGPETWREALFWPRGIFLDTSPAGLASLNAGRRTVPVVTCPVGHSVQYLRTIAGEDDLRPVPVCDRAPLLDRGPVLERGPVLDRVPLPQPDDVAAERLDEQGQRPHQRDDDQRPG